MVPLNPANRPTEMVRVLAFARDAEGLRSNVVPGVAGTVARDLDRGENVIEVRGKPQLREGASDVRERSFNATGVVETADETVSDVQDKARIESVSVGDGDGMAREPCRP